MTFRHLIMTVTALIAVATAARSEFYATDDALSIISRTAPITPLFKVHNDPSPGDAWEYRIVILNKDGTNAHKIIASTPAGEVTMRYYSRVGPNNPDEVTVIDWPEGYSVWPIVLNIDEEATGTVYLYKFLGV